MSETLSKVVGAFGKTKDVTVTTNNLKVRKGDKVCVDENGRIVPWYQNMPLEDEVFDMIGGTISSGSYITLNVLAMHKLSATRAIIVSAGGSAELIGDSGIGCSVWDWDLSMGSNWSQVSYQWNNAGPTTSTNCHASGGYLTEDDDYVWMYSTYYDSPTPRVNIFRISKLAGVVEWDSYAMAAGATCAPTVCGLRLDGAQGKLVLVGGNVNTFEVVDIDLLSDPVGGMLGGGAATANATDAFPGIAARSWSGFVMFGDQAYGFVQSSSKRATTSAFNKRETLDVYKFVYDSGADTYTDTWVCELEREGEVTGFLDEGSGNYSSSPNYLACRRYSGGGAGEVIYRDAANDRLFSVNCSSHSSGLHSKAPGGMSGGNPMFNGFGGDAIYSGVLAIREGRAVPSFDFNLVQRLALVDAGSQFPYGSSASDSENRGYIVFHSDDNFIYGVYGDPNSSTSLSVGRVRTFRYPLPSLKLSAPVGVALTDADSNGEFAARVLVSAERLDITGDWVSFDGVNFPAYSLKGVFDTSHVDKVANFGSKLAVTRTSGAVGEATIYTYTDALGGFFKNHVPETDTSNSIREDTGSFQVGMQGRHLVTNRHSSDSILHKADIYNI